MTYPPPPGWSPDLGAPFGRDRQGFPLSDKSKVTAGLLQLLLTLLCGVGGVGRLYAGHLGIGLTQLVGLLVSIPLIFVLIGIPLFAGLWIWSLVDGILMLTGDPRDGSGRRLRP